MSIFDFMDGLSSLFFLVYRWLYLGGGGTQVPLIEERNIMASFRNAVIISEVDQIVLENGESSNESQEPEAWPASTFQHIKDPISEANKKMDEYHDRIIELARIFPETYRKIKQFIDRGNCQCPAGAFTDRLGACKCTETGAFCLCSDPTYCTCRRDMRCTCQVKSVEHIVRVYEIHQGREEFTDFLKVHLFDAGKPEELEKLKEELVVAAKESEDAERQDNDPDSKNHSREKAVPYRLITVDHLSANVARLLGGLYNMPPDFFNRHLPGTEAISGRLISRLPSSVQIDLDELYESTEALPKLWPNMKIEDGHKLIQEAMEQNFLFQNVGWDYFPVKEEDWEASMGNTRMSAGYEITTKRKEEDMPKNIFQFNVTHRISVYSQPGRHPNTGE